MRFSDNHDERRAIARFGERGALAASALVFTLDGVPLLYNGMEAGDTTESGAPALFERLPIFWEIAERRSEFLRFYKQAIALRLAHRALIEGDTIWLRNSDESRIVTFSRRTATEEILVAINLSNRPFTGDVEAANGARFTDITPTIYSKSDRVASTNEAASVALALEAWGFRFLRRAL
jgi:glycosidase